MSGAGKSGGKGGRGKKSGDNFRLSRRQRHNFAKKKVLARQDVALTLRPEFSVGPGSVGMKLTF